MWWRRPQPFVLDEAITDAHDRGFARGECAAMVAGLVAVPGRGVGQRPRPGRGSVAQDVAAPRRERAGPAGAADLHDQQP